MAVVDYLVRLALAGAVVARLRVGSDRWGDTLQRARLMVAAAAEALTVAQVQEVLAAPGPITGSDHAAAV